MKKCYFEKVTKLVLKKYINMHILRGLWLHVFFGSTSTQRCWLQPGKGLLHNPSTFHGRLSIHTSQVSNRHCSNMQHHVPQHATIIAVRCRPQTIPLLSISLQKLETVGSWRSSRISMWTTGQICNTHFSNPARFLYWIQTSTTVRERHWKNRSYHADKIHSLSCEVETTNVEHENLPGIHCSLMWDVGSHHVKTIPGTKMTMACKHLRQLH